MISTPESRALRSRAPAVDHDGALRPLRGSLWSARPLVRGCACVGRVGRRKCSRRWRGRRARVVGAWRPCEGSAGVSRSRPFSTRVWYRQRGGDRLRQRVGQQIFDGDEPEPDDALSAVDRLRRPPALRARNQARRRGRGEPQAAARTRDVGHDGPLSKEASESPVEPAATTLASSVEARVVSVAVATANRLSALLSGNAALKARRAELTERPPRLAPPDPRTSNGASSSNGGFCVEIGVGYPRSAVCAARVERSSPPLGVWLPHASCGSISLGAKRSVRRMAKQIQRPAPGLSTSEAAFTELTKEIAQRNEQAQKQARKLRAAREQEQVRRRRIEDLR